MQSGLSALDGVSRAVCQSYHVSCAICRLQVSDDEKLETEVLFVLQKLCEKTGHPRGKKRTIT